MAEDRYSGPDTEHRKSNGRFAPGNPGKRPGTRAKATQAAEALLDGEAEGLTRKAVELALGGDATALRLCLDRILPPRKDRPITTVLPSLEGLGAARTVSAAVIEQVAAGTLSPSEGEALMGLVAEHVRIVEASELADRVAALEAAAAARTTR